MKSDPQEQQLPAEPEDIEIIEVVGMEQSNADGRGEVVISFDDEPAAETPPPTGVGASVESPMEDVGAEERLLRLRADFENLRKRIERERDEYHRHATASLVARLLPVLDNFERALAAARQSGRADPLLDGLALIQRQLLEELRREGLRPVECLGQPFDPSVHEAVATDATSRLPVNTVLEELQRGYYFDDRLLRPALVRVSVSERPDPEPPSGWEES